MFLSEKYPDIMASIEEKLKKQVEERGLDFEIVKRDVAAGFNYEMEYYGPTGFGSKYALIRTQLKPMFFTYKDIFLAYGTVLKSWGGLDVKSVVLCFNGGLEYPVAVRDAEDEFKILNLIEKGNRRALIGDYEEYKNLFKELRKHLGIVDMPPKNLTPDPVDKLPQKRIKSVLEKFERIIDLSKKLTDLDKNWYVKTSKALAKEDIMKWCEDNAAFLPEEYILFLTISNGFCVGYPSEVGYFNLLPFSTERDTEWLYRRSKEEMRSRNYKSYKNCKYSFGFLNHNVLYYNPYTGETFIEKERNHYDRIVDFEKEILDEVIAYLELKVQRFLQKDQRLKAAAGNPFKEWYDDLLKLNGKKEDFPRIIVYEPLSMHEISEWEKNHSIKLPKVYKDWLLLSNGLDAGYTYIYSLEKLDRNMRVHVPDKEKGYIVIADVSCGWRTFIFDPETAELYALDDEWDICGNLDFEYVFEEIFERFEDA